jgi:hypothetical protein
MDHSELKSIISELQELDERFKIGLTIFIEGAQGFHGNLRLLLDPHLFLEFEIQLNEIMQRYGLCLGFCMRAEATFVMVS